MFRFIKKLQHRICPRKYHHPDDILHFMPLECTNKNYSFGEYSYGAPRIIDYYKGGTEKIDDFSEAQRHQKVTIGKFCSIATDVCFLLNVDHRTDWISTYPFSQAFPEYSTHTGHPFSKGDITIANDVWIGKGATILSGVTIGNGAVIGCGAIISKDVEPYAIYVGNPQRCVKMRFSKQEIVQLNRICWWDWDIEKIKCAVPLLMSGNVELFIKKYG